MSKKIVGVIVIVLVIIGIVLAFIGFGNSKEPASNNPKPSTDAIKFKEEYEKLNGEKNSSGKEYRKITIDENNPFVYSGASEIVEKIKNKESFAVYFGFNSCPWCRSILPTLIKVAQDLNITKIYYVDVYSIRDTYELNSKGKPEKTKEGSQGYDELIELLSDVLSDYNLTDSKGKTVKTGEKRIYAPNIVSIIDGKPNKLTEGTSSLQTDGYMELTDEMLAESYDNIKCVLSCLEKKDTCSLAC